MNRNEVIASIMLEAADLLRESAGANGAVRKFYENRKHKDAFTRSMADNYDTTDSSMDDFTRRVRAKESKDFAEGSWGPYQKGTNNTRDKVNPLHKKINEKANAKKALREAVEALYDKAVLCEDAEEAGFYIEKADELQKAIDDIPEETPVEMEEYPTSVTGGEGEKLDLEEIKDLCDGDQEVIDLLTDDEDKSVTVDAVTESIFDYYL